MGFTSGRPVGLSLLMFCLFNTLTHAVNLDVVNQCSYTVWAAARPGGGRQLDPGQTWSITVASGSTLARIWGRTNCSFDGNGRGQCQTGDCNELLECQGYGTPPNTLAEFAFNYQTNNVDFFDISLVDGFNIPLELSPTTSACQGARCATDINGQCPDKLRTPGGCNSPCNVFKTNQYCCTTGSGTCAPTEYSSFFKNMCPDAYSNSQDDQTSGFSCPSGTNYRVVFCP